MALRILNWICRIVLAGIFLFSAYTKLESQLQFAATLSSYKLFPDSLILPISLYFPWVEIALGVLLLAGWKTQYVATGAVGLLSFFMAILTITYLRGIEADCGCFGPGDRISLLTIARDAAFLVPAIYLAAEARIQGRRVSGPALKRAY